MNTERKLQELLDKEAIRDCIMRYARSVDRRNSEALEQVFWPDARLDYGGGFVGSPAEFAAWAPVTIASMDTHHLVAQILVNLTSETTAMVESYHYVPHDAVRADPPFKLTVHGRYVDVFEKRNDEWRIARRDVTCDVYTHEPSSVKWQGEIFADDRGRGRADPHDLSSGKFDARLPQSAA